MTAVKNSVILKFNIKKIIKNPNSINELAIIFITGINPFPIKIGISVVKSRIISAEFIFLKKLVCRH